MTEQMADYGAAHRCCPRCYSSGIEQTLLGDFQTGPDYRDRNRASCGCGWIGIVHELVPGRPEAADGRPPRTGKWKLATHGPRRPQIRDRIAAQLRFLAAYGEAGAEDLQGSDHPEDRELAAALTAAAGWVTRLCDWYERVRKPAGGDVA